MSDTVGVLSEAGTAYPLHLVSHPVFVGVSVDHHTQFLVGFVQIITPIFWRGSCRSSHSVFDGVRVDHHTQFLVGLG